MSGPDTSRRGFSLLEAVIALTIVSLAIVAGLGAFAAELRVAGKARTAVELETLARESLAGLWLVPAQLLRPLPDSLRHGRFEPPFERYAWTRTVRPVLGTPDLLHAVVEVTGADGRFALETRLYRPAPRSFAR
ncbi:MAG TPA: type II secretion system protein [Gemmatimonadales bacterium]|jgi:prepilin-type N-terminal cleavage/methylation domain-containing protein|nr:type II secretion system protein [Gemmatimonadales bacterium]